MKIDVLQFVCNKKDIKIYKVIEKNLYITKMDLLLGGLPMVLETIGIKVPFNYRLEEIEKFQVYRIISTDTKDEIALIQVSDPNGIDFD